MKFKIPGNPIPLQRARVFKNTFYDPQLTAKKNYADEVLSQLSEKEKARLPITNPIHISVSFIFGMPKSWSKKKRNELEMSPHTAKKDLDNLIKWVGDALNGIIWEDDSIIWSIEAVKVWGIEGKTILEIGE
jgi:Holliday junction resolvase RusA-like endonuclease